MGVKKLLTYLTETWKPQAQCLDVQPHPPSSSTIIVDGSAFFITFAQNILTTLQRDGQRNQQQQFTFPDADIVGGDLQPICTALRFALERLKDVYNVEWIFAFDGRSGPVQPNLNTARDVVRDRRSQDKLENVTLKNLEYCAGELPVRANTDQSTNSVKFLTTQFRLIVETLGIKVLQLDDEVDVYIGSLVREYNPVCVLSNDTDLAVIDGIPTVLIGLAMPWDAMLHGCPIFQAPSTPEPPLTLHVIHSSDIRNLLNLQTVDDLYLAASLCGNDIVTEGIQVPNERFPIVAIARNIGSYPLDKQSQEVQASVAWYQAAASASPRHAPHHDVQDQEHDDLVRLNLPTTSTTFRMLRGEICVDTPIPLFNGAMGYKYDLFTFKRIRHAIAFLFDHEKILIDRRGLDVTKAVPVEHEPIVLTDDMKEVIPRIWKDRNTPGMAAATVPPTATAMPTPEQSLGVIGSLTEMNLEICTTFVQPQSGYASPIVAPPISMLLVLWTAHAGCTGQNEIRKLVEMMVLVYASERSTEPSTKRILSRVLGGLLHTTAGRPSTQRPTVRSLELVGLFDAAYDSTDSFLQHIVARDVVFKLAEPADVFSGTLLHVLSFASPLSFEGLVSAYDGWHSPPGPTEDKSVVGQLLRDVMTIIENSMKLFGAMFLRIRFRDPNDPTICSLKRPQPPPRVTGTVEMWNLEKEFGFIRIGDRGVFCHASKVLNGTPAKGRRVSLRITPSRKAGQHEAADVVLE